MQESHALFMGGDRSDSGPCGEAEPHFACLDRSARPEASNVRSLLSDWFSRYPPVARLEFRSRFQSDDDRSFLSAFTELYCHELLARLGYVVDPHPEPPSGTKRPDYLARGGNSAFYLEATLAAEMSDEEWGEQRRKNVVYDTLNRHVESPDFFLHLDIRGALATPPPGRRMAEQLSRWLATLDPDALTQQLRLHGLGSLPRRLLEMDGWRIEFTPVPKRVEARGRPGVRPIGSKFSGLVAVHTAEALRDAVCSKATWYGDLDLPYVIFVNVQAIDVDEDDIFDALFGGSVYHLPVGKGPLPMSRARDGAWIGPSGPQNTRVSAAVVARSLDPWNMGNRGVVLVHNPFATHPLAGRVAELPGWASHGERMERHAGEEASRILGLPDRWPYDGVEVTR